MPEDKIDAKPRTQIHERLNGCNIKSFLQKRRIIKARTPSGVIRVSKVPLQQQTKSDECSEHEWSSPEALPQLKNEPGFS